VVQRLGEAGADAGPPVQLEGGHPLQTPQLHQKFRTHRGGSN
jgi:hypothetical protein